MIERHKTERFVKTLFGQAREHEAMAFVTSLANADMRDIEGGERKLVTRDMNMLCAHAERWNKPGRGMFICVNMLAPDARQRSKESVSVLVALHADVDFKSIAIEPKEALFRIERIPFPPTMVVSSGNGYHCYWIFEDPLTATQANIELVELLNQQLIDVLSGDPGTHDVSRLMRLPGTHNTKNGEFKPVDIIYDDGDRHDISDLEEWLSIQSPVIPRAEGSAVALAATNPFLAAAKRLGFKPSIDVEQRLMAMSYQGSGDSSIHQTQLQVSASLLSRGVLKEEVVAVLLAATQAAAGEYGSRWNWRREEAAIARMCETWLAKNPMEIKEVKSVVNGNSVIPFEKRPAKTEQKKFTSEKIPLHITVGQSVIDVLSEQNVHLLVTAGQIWRYMDGLWSCPALEGRRWLEVVIETACRALDIPSSVKLVSETRQWILRHPDLYEDEVQWDAHGCIPTKSGLVHPVTFEIEAPKPEHRATWRIECEFDPKAQCPWWEQMLRDTFSDRTDADRDKTISIIQEIVGSALVEDKPRSLTRALVLQGAPEAGKSQLLEVFSGLLSDRPISTPLEALEGTHGTMPFKRRAPWVLHEAFDQSKWHFSSKVKQILTGDPIEINTKSGLIETIRVKAPVFWGTNHPPSFKESTRAIVSRMVIIKCRAVFSKNNPMGAGKEALRQGFSEPRDLVLQTEMPGLLNWALAGLQRATQRGFFETTLEIEETLEEVRTDTNMAAGFLEECIEFDAYNMVSVPDFCAAFSVWWAENKGEARGGPSNDSIGRAMSSLGDARIGTDRVELRDNSKRYYAGIKLSQVGLDYWAAASNGGLASGKTARISSSRDDVNRMVPASWDERPAVKRLRQAALAAAEMSGDTVSDTSNREVSLGEKCHDTSPRF